MEAAWQGTREYLSLLLASWVALLARSYIAREKDARPCRAGHCGCEIDWVRGGLEGFKSGGADDFGSECTNASRAATMRVLSTIREGGKRHTHPISTHTAGHIFLRSSASSSNASKRMKVSSADDHKCLPVVSYLYETTSTCRLIYMIIIFALEV